MVFQNYWFDLIQIYSVYFHYIEVFMYQILKQSVKFEVSIL